VPRVERDAPADPAVALRQQKPAAGWSVVTGQGCEFLVEALEAEAEPERGCVFQEEFARSGDISRGLRLDDRD
jgi:hypothetical protein